MKAVVFDFNGTMFQDSAIHELAWRKIITKYHGLPLNRGAIDQYLHGRTNQEIINHFITKQKTPKIINQIASEKEALYRSLCSETNRILELVEGLPELLDELVARKIPITIASATTKENMLFYFEVFKLAKWFQFEHVVFDDGQFNSKPAPDIFLLAAQKIRCSPCECLVFEDSISGITAAGRAKIGNIIAIRTPIPVVLPEGIIQIKNYREFILEKYL